MHFLVAILQEIIGPILMLVLVGAVIQRRFSFDLRSFSYLLTYVLLPAAVFSSLYETTIEFALLGQLLFYLIVFSISLMVISHLFARWLQLPREEQATFKNSIVLINSGNYGVPVSQMIFSTQPIGVTIQIMTMIFQNITTYSYGLYNLISTSKSGLDIARELFKLPIIHALWIGSALNYFNVPLPIYVALPIEQLADAFIAIALLLLGAQLSQLQFSAMFNRVIYWSAFLRLVVGPAVAFGLILLFRLDGVVAQSLFIASSFPTSRNSSSLAFEYDVDPDGAAQMVLFSTIMSACTVTVVIFIAQFMW